MANTPVFLPGEIPWTEGNSYIYIYISGEQALKRQKRKNKTERLKILVKSFLLCVRSQENGMGEKKR